MFKGEGNPIIIQCFKNVISYQQNNELLHSTFFG